MHRSFTYQDMKRSEDGLSSTGEDTVSPQHVRVLSCAIDLQGHNSLAVLQRCGIESLQALRDDQWVPMSVLDKLMREAAIETRDPGFGLTAGSSLAMARHGWFAPLVLNMPSLEQGFIDVRRFCKLSLPRPEFRIESHGDYFTMVAMPLGETEFGLRFRTEFTMCGLIQMLRLVGALPADIKGLTFSYAAPDYHERYRQVFGLPVLFDQPQTGLTFHSKLMKAQPAYHDEGAYLDTVKRAELALARRNAERDIVPRLKVLLYKHGRQDLKMPQAAQLLNMSERSLRRLLTDAGVSYADLQRECLRLLAERRLADTRRPIKLIASELGFTSISTFHRTFKNWTGYTPNGWREACLTPEAIALETQG